MYSEVLQSHQVVPRDNRDLTESQEINVNSER
jgi:hypothetical protein